MLVRFGRRAASASPVLAVALGALLCAGAPAFAAPPPLTGGDKSATVTLGMRPLSADTDHVVAFERGGTLYVCVQDLKQMASGSMTRSGNQFTVQSFKGDANSRKFVFTIGSTEATAGGKPVTLTAPVVAAYHHVYVPLSFFGSGAVRTKVKISADGRTGDIIVPADMM